MCASGEQHRAAMDELVGLVYDELREVARYYFRNQPPSFTLRPTDLVDEACLHLLRHAREEWQSPEHFRVIATKKIYQVVVDHLRRRCAQKRGRCIHPSSGTDDRASAGEAAGTHHAPGAKRHRVPMETVAVEWRDRSVDLLDLADALEDLGKESRRLREIVMLHWFGGMKHAEVARATGLSESTVEKDFRYALAWLNRHLTGASGDGD